MNREEKGRKGKNREEKKRKGRAVYTDCIGEDGVGCCCC